MTTEELRAITDVDELDPGELMVISVVQYTQFILNMLVPRIGSYAHFFFFSKEPYTKQEKKRSA